MIGQRSLLRTEGAESAETRPTSLLYHGWTTTWAKFELSTLTEVTSGIK